MGKSLTKSERKSRKSGVGAFFGGTFVGFLLGLAAIAGICVFAYFKVSPEWLNKTFKTDINLGSEQANKVTLSDVVSSAMSILSNTSTYTLNDLNKDLGVEVPDKLLGIDIVDLKGVAIGDLGSAIGDKFANISIKELEGLLTDTDSLEHITKQTLTYYYGQDTDLTYKLFKEDTLDNKVDFDYTLEAGKVKIKAFEPIEIKDNKVEITLDMLPITIALGEFTTNLGDNITIAELKDFGVKLPSYFDNVSEDATINELETEINKLYVGELLNYTIDDTNPGAPIITNGTTRVTGIMAIIAKQRIGNLKNFKEIIEDTVIAEVLDLNIKQDPTSGKYYNDKNNDNKLDSGEEVAKVLKTIAHTKVINLPSVINGLKLSQVFDIPEKGLLALIEGDPTIDKLPEAIQTVIKTKNLNDLVNNGLISLNSDDKAKLQTVISYNIDEDAEVESVTVGQLKIEQLIDYCFDAIPNPST